MSVNGNTKHSWRSLSKFTQPKVLFDDALTSLLLKYKTFLRHNRQRVVAGLCTTFHGWSTPAETTNVSTRKTHLFDFAFDCVTIKNLDWKIGNRNWNLSALFGFVDGEHQWQLSSCRGHESICINRNLLAVLIGTEHTCWWCWWPCIQLKKQWTIDANKFHRWPGNFCGSTASLWCQQLATINWICLRSAEDVRFLLDFHTAKTNCANIELAGNEQGENERNKLGEVSCDLKADNVGEKFGEGNSINWRRNLLTFSIFISTTSTNITLCFSGKSFKFPVQIVSVFLSRTLFFLTCKCITKWS